MCGVIVQNNSIIILHNMLVSAVWNTGRELQRRQQLRQKWWLSNSSANNYQDGPPCLQNWEYKQHNTMLREVWWNVCTKLMSKWCAVTQLPHLLVGQLSWQPPWGQDHSDGNKNLKRDVHWTRDFQLYWQSHQEVPCVFCVTASRLLINLALTFHHTSWWNLYVQPLIWSQNPCSEYSD